MELVLEFALVVKILLEIGLLLEPTTKLTLMAKLICRKFFLHQLLKSVYWLLFFLLLLDLLLLFLDCQGLIPASCRDYEVLDLLKR